MSPDAFLGLLELAISHLRKVGELTPPTFASSVDRHLYFVHALPSDATSVSLPDLHQILNDYLNRNEAELVELKHEREGRSWRKGEGKGKRETELEKLREEEESEYKTGFGASGVEMCVRRNGPVADFVLPVLLSQSSLT